MTIKRNDNKRNVVSFTRDAEFYFNRAMQAYDKGNLRRVQELLLTAVKLKPEDVWNHFNLALTLEELGKYREAIAVWETDVLGRDAMLAEAYFHLALCYAETGRVDLTTEYLEHYLDIEPDGELSSVARQIINAISEDLDSESDLALLEPDNLALIQEVEAEVAKLIKDNAYQEAAMRYDQLIEEIGPNVYVLNKAAILYFMAKEAQKGLFYSNLVLQQDRNNVEAHCNLVFYYHEVKNELKVQSLIEDMDEASFISLKDVTHWAYALSVIGKHRRAYELLRDVYWEGEYNVELLNMLALNALYLHKTAAAADYWKQAACLANEPIPANLYLDLLSKINDISAILQIAEFQNQWPLLRILTIYRTDKSFKEYSQAEQKVLQFCLHWFIDSKFKYLVKFTCDSLNLLPEQQASELLQKLLMSDHDDLKYDVLKKYQHMIKSCRTIRFGTTVFRLSFEDYRFVSDVYQQVQDILQSKKQGLKDPWLLEIGIAIWRSYCADVAVGSNIIRKPEVWSAAIEQIVFECLQLSFVKKEILQKYGVSYAAVNRAKSKVYGVFQADTTYKFGE